MGRASDPHEQREEKRYQASQRAAERYLQRLAIRVEYLSRFVDDPSDGETYINSIQFKVGAGWDGGVLAIVKAVIGGEKRVAFHGEETLDECIVGLSSRLANGNLKWKEDKPYETGNK